MPKIVQVAYRKLKEVGYFQVFDQIELTTSEECLVDTENGLEVGTVLSLPRIVENQPADIRKVIRRLSREDRNQITFNQKKEEEAFRSCVEKVEDRELNMKLVTVEYTFSRNKLFIYYTAPERVDFRELVKDLAYIFKTRIEMCQVGVRDEAKMVGGFGCCGRRLCCVTFLKDFKPVTIDMAKEQELSLASSKISGVCGRLMCCLSYEYTFYQEEKKRYPEIDTKLKVKEGVGKVRGINILRQTVTLEMEDGTIREYKAAELNVIKNGEKEAKK
ncbi:MAG: stage 0 sporulation family protein [bacterium]|nr:stage 0 sporulation family protein [bacterium]MDD5354502.1 stage 0 sporulation family protein [bacterium]MDD5756276.1 stage 0 sporulation family protein [bacterium]